MRVPPKKVTDKVLGPHFGDIGAEWVEWNSPEHISMQHGFLRGMARRKKENMADNITEQPKFDLDFRPKEYWTTPDPTFALLDAIPQLDKRERAKKLAEKFDRNAMVNLNEEGQLTDQEIQFYQACGLYVFDEEYGNEASFEEPLEIAGAGFDVGNGFADSHFSAILIVKRCVGQTAFRLQGQGEGGNDVHADDTEETSLEDEWLLLEDNQPLSMKEVADTLEEYLPHGNVALCLSERWNAMDDHTEDALSLLDVGVDSGFYPDLSSYFDNKTEEWRQSVRDKGQVEKTEQ